VIREGFEGGRAPDAASVSNRKLLEITLFGSYARGDRVDDPVKESQ
jgi:predicted nucleotidyltransferase